MPNADLNEGARGHLSPLAAGSIELRDGVLEGLLSIPADVLSPLLTALAAEQLKYMVQDGWKLRYRMSQVRHFRLDSDVDEEDFEAWIYLVRTKQKTNKTNVI
jgi:hypothetical protein